VKWVRFSLAPDGTALIHATLVDPQSTSSTSGAPRGASDNNPLDDNPDADTDSTPTTAATTPRAVEQGEFHIRLNMFPVFVLDALPSSLQIHAPVPTFGAFISAQKSFRELVARDLEAGLMVVVLQPKVCRHMVALFQHYYTWGCKKPRI